MWGCPQFFAWPGFWPDFLPDLRAGAAGMSMGELIRIDSRRRLILGQLQHVGDAEILMFTGVRYERTKNPGPDNRTVAARGPARPRKSKRR